MEQTRIWVVEVDGREEPFGELDTAVAYVRAELLAGRQPRAVSSRLMTEAAALELLEAAE